MSGAQVPIKTLLVTVFESVIQVFLLCLAGYVLSRAGVTDKATQRKLNVINVSLFTPALLFSKVAFSLTPGKLKEMWIIPLGFVLVTAVSAGVAWGLSRAFRLSRSQTAFAICASMFQNSNSLPIALIQSLVIEVPHLKWGADDSKDQMLGRALTYLVLYSTLGMMLRWSWGVKLLSQADEEVPEVESAIPPQIHLSSDQHVRSPESLIPHPAAQETDPFFANTHSLSLADEEERIGRNSLSVLHEHPRDSSPSPSISWLTGPGSALSMHPPGVSRAMTSSSARASSVPPRKHVTRTESGREFWGLPEAPRRQRLMLSPEPEDSSDEDDEDDLTPLSLRRRNTSTPPTTRLRALMSQIKHGARTTLKAVNAFMTVPMYAALLSIFIALIPPLQASIGKIKPFEEAVRSAGQCSIPVTLVVLGAFFYAPSQPSIPPPQSPSESNTSLGYFERKFRSIVHSSNPVYSGENKTVFVAVISRMVVVPLLMLPLIALIARTDPFEAAEDPVFILSAVLLVSSPPALTLAQITQAASGDAFERLISKTISWSYAVLTPP
ncbi:endoplasmic reticulum protein [Tremella mesenterica]|uniref:Endoplasmic reticulum protein n=1 Tax=Tremella mesenterica TaxID=5217 RepID=A0A4Q1BHV3_TREME|nr:endoplasmic reticulum protein [Tremella mesenterica]